MYLKPEKGTSFERSLPVWAIIGSPLPPPPPMEKCQQIVAYPDHCNKKDDLNNYVDRRGCYPALAFSQHHPRSAKFWSYHAIAECLIIRLNSLNEHL